MTNIKIEAHRRRGRERSIESEQAILDASMILLIKYGYSGLTLNRLAAEAHVSKATIYRRWKSKEDIVIAALGAIPPIVPSFSGTVVENICEFIKDFVKIVQGNSDRRRSETRMVTMLPSLAVHAEKNKALKRALKKYISDREAPLKEILRNAISKKKFLIIQTSISLHRP